MIIKNVFFVINYRGIELELKVNIIYLGCICLINRSKNWREKIYLEMEINYFL